MKYETYSQMSAELKEEYVYRFKDSLPKAPFESWIMTSVLIWLVLSTLILAIYISMTSKEPSLIELQPTLIKTLDRFGTGLNLFWTVFMVYLVLWITKAALFVYSERKWLKQNGIENK